MAEEKNEKYIGSRFKGNDLNVYEEAYRLRCQKEGRDLKMAEFLTMCFNDELSKLKIGDSKVKEYANNTAEEIAESKFKSLEGWLIKLFEQGATIQELLNLILIIKSKDNTIHQNAVLAYRNNKDKEAEDREIEYQNCNKLEDYVEAEKELLIDVGLENPEFISVAKAIVDRKMSDFEETEGPDDGLSDEELYQQNRQQ